MKWTWLVVALVSGAAWAGAPLKLFVDQGKTYARTDQQGALTPGAELDALAAADGPPVGKAVVMEVSGQLIRLSLDEDAARQKAKFVRLGEVAAPAAPQNLQGALAFGKKVIVVSNASDTRWSDCTLLFSDRRRGAVGAVEPRANVAVDYKQLITPDDPAEDRVTVRCGEGEAEFLFDEPARKTALKGFAEGRKGKVWVHNESDSAWTACDVIKPDGTHYVLGGLKAHGEDSIRASLFKEPSAAPTVTLRCAQGALTVPVP